MTSAEDLAEYVPAWDELAMDEGLPYCAPAWMLAWWRELAPSRSALRVVVAVDEGRLVGVLPLYRHGPPTRLRVWRQLCAGFCTRVGPLAVPGREEVVAGAFAAALAGPGGPDMLALEGLPGGSPWPRLLREAWPRRPAPVERREYSMRAPIAVLDEGFDAWFARREASVRRETRRRRRRLEEQDVVIRRAEPAELEPAVRALCAHYRARWGSEGSPERLGAGLEHMLLAAGRGLGDRFQLWLLARGDETLGAHLFVGAGADLSAWGGGFQAEWGRYSPTLVLRVAAVEHAAGQGVERVEFGEGAQVEKVRFADDALGVDWATLLPRGRRYPLARGQLLPRDARRRAKRAVRRLPPSLREPTLNAARAILRSG